MAVLITIVLIVLFIMLMIGAVSFISSLIGGVMDVLSEPGRRRAEAGQAATRALLAEIEADREASKAAALKEKKRREQWRAQQMQWWKEQAGFKANLKQDNLEQERNFRAMVAAGILPPDIYELLSDVELKQETEEQWIARWTRNNARMEQHHRGLSQARPLSTLKQAEARINHCR